MRINCIQKNNINFNGYNAILAHSTTKNSDDILYYTLLTVKLDNEGERDLDNYHNVLSSIPNSYRIPNSKPFDTPDDIVSIFYARLINPRTGIVHQKQMFLNDIYIDFSTLNKFTNKATTFIADLTKRIKVRNIPLCSKTNDTKEMYIHSYKKIKSAANKNINSLNLITMNDREVVNYLGKALMQRVHFQDVADLLNKAVQKSMEHHFIII